MDPRDLSWNQYHWALQHPIAHKGQAEISAYREGGAELDGIDNFVNKIDNNIHFRAFRAIERRLRANDDDVLVISYSELCLDFDNLLVRLAGFLGVCIGDVPSERLEIERPANLAGNPAWIGRAWTGADTAPGRHRHELRPETVRALDEKYRRRSCSSDPWNSRAVSGHLLATDREANEMEQVMVGKSAQFFLVKDSNDGIGQITGNGPSVAVVTWFCIAMAHCALCIFGHTVGCFRYEHAVIPDKQVVLREHLPEDFQFEGDGPCPLRQFLESPASSIWRPFYEPEVLKAPPGEKYFADTGTHWEPRRGIPLFGHVFQCDASCRCGDDGGLAASPTHVLAAGRPWSQAGNVARTDRNLVTYPDYRGITL